MTVHEHRALETRKAQCKDKEPSINKLNWKVNLTFYGQCDLEQFI